MWFYISNKITAILPSRGVWGLITPMLLTLTPTFVITDITHLSPEALLAKGIKGLVFDLDNTIMAPHTGVVWPKITAWLQTLTGAGLPYNVVSNNKNLVYLNQAQQALGVTVFGHAKKPSTAVLAQAVAQLNLPPSQVAVVGDRPLTDIWAAQRLGCPSVLVDPLMRSHEHGIIHLLRALERLPVKAPQHPPVAST
jgi:uncharacterized protein